MKCTYLKKKKGVETCGFYDDHKYDCPLLGDDEVECLDLPLEQAGRLPLKRK